MKILNYPGVPGLIIIGTILTIIATMWVAQGNTVEKLGAILVIILIAPITIAIFLKPS